MSCSEIKFISVDSSFLNITSANAYHLGFGIFTVVDLK